MKDKKEVIAYIENDHHFSVCQPKEEFLRLYCNKCKTSTSHRTIVHAYAQTEEPYGYVFTFENYRIVECSGCHSIRFVESNIHSEDQEYEEKIDSNKLHCHVYPISEEHDLTKSQPSELEAVLPDCVKSIYKETIAAIKSELFILAGIGLRAILETVCKDKNIGGKRSPLEKRLIVMLEDRHLITAEEKAILDEVRQFGNDSAHEGKYLSAYEVKCALIAISHILDKLYLIPSLKEELEFDRMCVKMLESSTNNKKKEN